MKLDISDVQTSTKKLPYKKLSSINSPKNDPNLNFSKKSKFSNEEEKNENENENLLNNENNHSNIPRLQQTNRYFLNWTPSEIELEKNTRLKNINYGPCILVARNRKEYYQMMSFRRYRLFKLKTIKEIESKYIPEDRYYQSIKDFKNRLENMNEKNIRDFLKIFYYEE